jgi:hypothetical protein
VRRGGLPQGVRCTRPSSHSGAKPCDARAGVPFPLRRVRAARAALTARARPPRRTFLQAYHPRCIGLTGREAAALREAADGRTWECGWHRCRDDPALQPGSGHDPEQALRADFRCLTCPNAWSARRVPASPAFAPVPGCGAGLCATCQPLVACVEATPDGAPRRARADAQPQPRTRTLPRALRSETDAARARAGANAHVDAQARRRPTQGCPAPAAAW